MNKRNSEDQAVSLKGDSMNAPRSQDQAVFPAGVEPVIQLWLLRLLVPLGAFKKGFGRDSFDEELLASLAQIFAVDIESCITQDGHGNRKLDCEKAFQRFDELHANAEKTLKHATPPECLTKMVQCMSELLGGLSATDCRILEFLAFRHAVKVLQQTGNLLGDLKKEQLFQAFSVILDLPLEEVRDALSKNGALYRLGLRLRRRNYNLGKRRKPGKLEKLLIDIRLTRALLSNFLKFLGFEDFKDFLLSFQRSEALTKKSVEQKFNTLESLEEEWQRWKATQEECGLKMREDPKRSKASFWTRSVVCCWLVWMILKNIDVIIGSAKERIRNLIDDCILDGCAVFTRAVLLQLE